MLGNFGGGAMMLVFGLLAALFHVRSGGQAKLSIVVP
jgi:crotonobetainyl-CoA:carnitine CoA-transferase CaiB-like acyl-CoA transferase